MILSQAIMLDLLQRGGSLSHHYCYFELPVLFKVVKLGEGARLHGCKPPISTAQSEQESQ